MKILVTGGTGHLGRAIVARLADHGDEVRVLARRPGGERSIEWVRGDFATGAGVIEAVAGVDAVIHAATNSPAAQRGGFRPLDFVRSPTDVDIDGARALLAAADEAAVHHVSIVGLRQMAKINPYSRVKLAAEELVKTSPVPWSIVRASGFYWLLERMLAKMGRRPILMLPGDVRMQPVDSDDFADFVVACMSDGQRGERKDFVGPETLTMRQLAEQYLAARGLRRRVWNAPMPRRVKAALDAGNTSTNALHGTTTWAEWLERSAPALLESSRQPFAISDRSLSCVASAHTTSGGLIKHCGSDLGAPTTRASCSPHHDRLMVIADDEAEAARVKGRTPIPKESEASS
jgi:uncharacterized protein YbjT (DUF2867 family)